MHPLLIHLHATTTRRPHPPPHTYSLNLLTNFTTWKMSEYTPKAAAPDSLLPSNSSPLPPTPPYQATSPQPCDPTDNSHVVKLVRRLRE